MVAHRDSRSPHLPKVNLQKRTHFQPAMNSGLCDKNENDLANPVWLALAHELGGHAYYRFVQPDPDNNESGHAVDYENKVRTLHGGVKEQRPYDEAHPDPAPKKK